MGHDRVPAVLDAGVIAALVEHSHIQPQHTGEIHGPRHTALVGADDHHMTAVDPKLRFYLQQIFDELVDRRHRLETDARDRVLHARIMRVKRDDILHAHIGQFLERQRAVQGFAAGALMLPALVQKRHDHIDPARLAGRRRDDPLQILKMIVRGHMVRPPAQRIGQAVIADVHHDIQIVPAYRLLDRTLGLAGAEPGRPGFDDIGIPLITGESDRRFMLALTIMSPGDQILVYLLAKVPDTAKRDQSQWPHRDRLDGLLLVYHVLLQMM